MTYLIIKYFHEKTKHQGRGITLNEIRENGFWIVGGMSAVASYIANCVTCCKLGASVQEQKMANLPEDRLEPAPPFTNCAMDYFRPWLVKEGRKEGSEKILFTCLASRAIHLETANALDTDSFLNALRRVVCRRGAIRQIRSDQGTNFVGARRGLREALAELDQDKITSALLKKGCDWITFKMNPPHASHRGGVWERQIRSVRSVLSSLLESNGAQLNDESLRTLMCEVEAILNSRPLTVDTLNDPNSLSPLTPNHLLTMKSKIVLPPPGSFQEADKYSRRRWRKEYLQNLKTRAKWCRPRKDLGVGDVVTIKDEDTPHNKWQLARVLEAIQSSDGRIPSVRLDIAENRLDSKGRRIKKPRFLERPVQKLVLLMSKDQYEGDRE